MSIPAQTHAAALGADFIEAAERALRSGMLEQVSDGELERVMTVAVRLYAAKAEDGMRTPLPPGGGGVTITDAMLLTTDLLHALNVQLFELSMWQAMTGNSIAPHQRIDTPHNR